MSPVARRILDWLRRIAPWALAVVVLVLVARQARTLDWVAVWHSLQDLSLPRLLAAASLALLSHVLYANFDLIGRRLTGHALPIPRTVITAAISYAFNLNFGALVGGLGVRLRLYMRAGLSAPVVAKVIAYSMVTNWLGYLMVAGGVLLWVPPSLDASWDPGATGWRFIGMGMVTLSIAYLALCAVSDQRQLCWGAHNIELPCARFAGLQALLGGINWLLMGAIVWILFGDRINYTTVLGALLLAAMAGVLTHVPAGLGVLEAVFVATIGGRMADAEVVATVLAYRAAYYVLPLAAALPAWVWIEIAWRSHSTAARLLPTKEV